jgi:hypothetical protein
MVEELEISAIKLVAKREEEAWREMAKQVAHEIKTRPQCVSLYKASKENLIQETLKSYKNERLLRH